MEISGIDSPNEKLNLNSDLELHQGDTTYFDYVRPAFKKLLESFGLAKSYFKAEGDFLFYRDSTGHEVKVLDLLGGYGANLLGHNDPDLVRSLVNAVSEKRAFIAQASVRSKAGNLAKLLNLHLKRETGQEYIIHFGNTGAEATEIAIKHCELFFQQKLQAEVAVLHSHLQKIFSLSRKDQIKFFFKNGLSVFIFLLYQFDGVFSFIFKNMRRLNSKNLPYLASEIIEKYQKYLLQQAGVFITLKKSFHGKTTGATALSDNYKKQFLRIAMRSIAVGDAITLCRLVDRQYIKTVDFDYSNGIPRFKIKKISRVLGIFVEPIQGEGGIHCLSPEMTTVLNNISKQMQIPLIADESQSGLGRTGYFLAGTHFGLQPNIILLSKGLGGSLTKLSCVAIEKSHYQSQLGILQTSTFAEDDLSSIVATNVLGKLADRDFYLFRQATQTGNWIKLQFAILREEFPEIIKDFRGEGLMLGIEFKSQSANYSGSFRFLSVHDKLTWLITSYLLNIHHIRIAPCLSNPWVLRIEPSLNIQTVEIEAFIYSIKSVCEIIKMGRADVMLQAILGDNLNYANLLDLKALESPTFQTQLSRNRKFRVAFLAYVSDPQYMSEWDESLSYLSSEQIMKLFDKLQNVLMEPHGIAEFTITSSTGAQVEFQYYGLPADANYFANAWKQNDTAPLNLIERAVEMAAQNNCKMLALGGFTSILAANGTALKARREIAYTTGNSLTAGVAFEAIIELCRSQKIVLSEANLGVVGANGNMGRVLSQLFAEKVDFLSLFVRAGKERGVKENLVHLINRGKKNPDLFDKGIYRILKKIAGFELWFNDKMSTQQWLDHFILKSPKSPFLITSDFKNLKDCSVIVSSSNTEEPLIHSQHIGSQSVIICDLAIPADVSDAVKELSQVYYFAGGVVELPEGNEVQTLGSGLPPNRVYACLAESLLLGLERHTENFSYGHLEIEKVQWILEKFHKHGFKIDLKCEKTLGHFKGFRYEN